MTNQDFLNPDESIAMEQERNTGENLVLNLTDVSEEKPRFEAMPAGVYNCIIDNVEYSISQADNPMLTFTFRVVDEEYDGRLLFYHTVLNKESGLSRLKRLLVRVCPDIDLSHFDPAAFADTGDALGLPLKVKVRVRSYKGERRNEVTDVLPPDEDANAFLDA